MNFKADYRTLFELRRDLHEQSKKSIAFRLLNQQRIAYFNEFNKTTLAKADAQDKALVKKYVEHNASGHPMNERVENGLVFYRFPDHAAKENFTREYHKLMSTPCTIGI